MYPFLVHVNCIKIHLYFFLWANCEWKRAWWLIIEFLQYRGNFSWSEADKRFSVLGSGSWTHPFSPLKLPPKVLFILLGSMILWLFSWQFIYSYLVKALLYNHSEECSHVQSIIQWPRSVEQVSLIWGTQWGCLIVVRVTQDIFFTMKWWIVPLSAKLILVTDYNLPFFNLNITWSKLINDTFGFLFA